MIYIVNIDYKEFKFGDGTDALNFAEVAAETSDKSVRVSIEIRKGGAA